MHPCRLPVIPLLAVGLALALVTVLAPAAVPLDEGPADLHQSGAGGAVDRLAGGDRFATAAAVAMTAFPDGANSVLLARGDAYADALTASALAGATAAPLLLTGADELPQATAQAIGDLGVTEVVLVGGPDAVGQGVVAALQSRGLSVSRVGGVDRYATAAEVANQVARSGSLGLLDGRTTAFVASGVDYPDALVAGGAAFAGPHPILLSTGQQLGSTTVQILDDLDIEQVILLGGTAVLGAAIEAELDVLGIAHRRLGGATRLETAARVADFTVQEFGFTLDRVLLARGDDFPDALAAGPYAGATGSPILLTAGTNQLGATSADWLRSWCGVIQRVTAIGANGVIADMILAAATAALDCGAPLPGGPTSVRELLDADQQTFATSVGGWVPQGNTTISRTDDLGRNDDHAMEILVDPGGPFDDDSRTARVGTRTARAGVPVVAGQTYQASWWIRPDGPASPVHCELRWYDEGGNIVETVPGETVMEIPGEWVQARCDGVAPPTAAFAAVRVFIAEADYGDRHHVDDASLRGTGPTDDPAPDPTTEPPADDPPAEPPAGIPGNYPDGPGDTGIAAANLQLDDLEPSGTITVGSGEVVDGLLISGSIILEQGARDVVIRNTVIEGSGRYGIESNPGVRGLLIENVTIEGRSGGRSAGILAIGEGIIRGVDVSGYADGIKVFSTFVVERSWIHDLVDLGESHNDGIQGVGGSGLVIRNNRIEAPYQAQTSAILIQAANNPVSDVTIEGNLLSGGTYTLYVTNKDDQPAPTDVTITGNAFDGVSDQPSTVEPANSWRFGPCTYDRGAGWVNSGNTFRDGSPAPC